MNDSFLKTSFFYFSDIEYIFKRAVLDYID